MRQENVYEVVGMTCAHCRSAVLSEVGAVGGVSEVEVDLATGRLTVRGERLDDATIAAAVLEAGYEVRR